MKCCRHSWLSQRIPEANSQVGWGPQWCPPRLVPLACALLIASSFKVVLVSPDIVLLSFLFYLLASLFFAAPSPRPPNCGWSPSSSAYLGDGSSAPRHPSVTRSPLSRLLILPMQHGQSEFDLPFPPNHFHSPAFPLQAEAGNSE